jgi:hypothetical protein
MILCQVFGHSAKTYLALDKGFAERPLGKEFIGKKIFCRVLHVRYSAKAFVECHISTWQR